MKLRIITCLFVLFIISISSVLCAVETSTETIIVSGESPIYDGKVEPARQRALEDSFRNAVRKILGTMVTAESYTQNAISIDDSIVTKAKGYIKTYDILGEQKDKESILLKVKVILSIEPIKDDLTAMKILIDAMGNPRIVQLIDEDGQETISHSYAAEQITKIFTKNGFNCVDPFSTGNITEKEILNAFEKGDFIGLDSDKLKADILMLGKGRVENITNIEISGLIGCIVNLDIKVIRIETGKIVTEQSTRINGVGANRESAYKNAFSKAGEDISDLLIDEIIKAWGSSLLNGRDISLEVSVDDYTKLKDFKKRVSHLFGVKQISQKYFKDGKALFLLKFTGSAQTLAEIISTTYFMDIKVAIAELSNDVVKVKIN
ncbi:MAG: hypothetical protein HOI47_12010 [Candidatus Scalindua sp.]|nr:hypothetical protein [Candidatus Scalindua sp.]